jgi:hypothetical protein
VDDLEPEDLLPEDVEGTPDPVTLQPNPTDELRVWQQKVSNSVFDQPAHTPPAPLPDNG